MDNPYAPGAGTPPELAMKRIMPGDDWDVAYPCLIRSAARQTVSAPLVRVATLRRRS
jgi:hypothetical protein